MCSRPRVWIQPELDYLAEIYAEVEKNESRIAQLTRQLEEISALLNEGEKLRSFVEFSAADAESDKAKNQN